MINKRLPIYHPVQLFSNDLTCLNTSTIGNYKIDVMCLEVSSTLSYKWRTNIFTLQGKYLKGKDFLSYKEAIEYLLDAGYL